MSTTVKREKVVDEEETSNKKSKVASIGGDAIFDLGKTKKVSVTEYKGITLVNIREFYVDKKDGKEKPGKKGISLSVEQWTNLKSVFQDIDLAISNLQ